MLTSIIILAGLFLIAMLFTRALIWGLYYLFFYLLVAQLGNRLLASLGPYLISFSTEVYWVSRIIYLVIAVLLGGAIRHRLNRHRTLQKLLTVVIIVIALLLIWQSASIEYHLLPAPGTWL